MKLSDLKLGQKVSINGIPSEYQGIRKVEIPNFGKVEKRVFRRDENGECIYYNIIDGTKLLKNLGIKLL
ncbi:hypothetical protein [Elizabethkingia miricola]|uniref:Uncharacterized protein n=1 Tax=Elizabethkingia miricola TaxID=172045 RepID=A0ABD5B8G4_ELIMR|nr:hypothetical protein [Elizabethkingia miricola]MDQ8749946.1 hypothetical protein [Elizabethkingia miricola]